MTPKFPGVTPQSHPWTANGRSKNASATQPRFFIDFGSILGVILMIFWSFWPPKSTIWHPKTNPKNSKMHPRRFFVSRTFFVCCSSFQAPVQQKIYYGSYTCNMQFNNIVYIKRAEFCKFWFHLTSQQTQTHEQNFHVWLLMVQARWRERGFAALKIF